MLDLRLEHSNILIVNLGLIGDVLLTTPFIRAIRAILPKAKIHVLVPPWSSSVLSHNPHVDYLHTYKAFWNDPSHSHSPSLDSFVDTIRIWRQLRRFRFDLVINTWFADQPLTAGLLRLFKSAFIIGFDFPYSSRFYDRAFPFDRNAHIVDNLLELARVVSVDTIMSS
jgi:ADP-heptose:LPS heptosyltransferase